MNYDSYVSSYYWNWKILKLFLVFNNLKINSVPACEYDRNLYVRLYDIVTLK